jgi:hypothetical protein
MVVRPGFSLCTSARCFSHLPVCVKGLARGPRRVPLPAQPDPGTVTQRPRPGSPTLCPGPLDAQPEPRLTLRNKTVEFMHRGLMAQPGCCVSWQLVHRGHRLPPGRLLDPALIPYESVEARASIHAAAADSPRGPARVCVRTAPVSGRRARACAPALARRPAGCSARRTAPGAQRAQSACACVRVRVRAYVRAYVRARVRAPSTPAGPDRRYATGGHARRRTCCKWNWRMSSRCKFWKQEGCA